MSLTKTECESLIQRYAEGPGKLRAAWAAVPPEARQWRPKAGEWSAHEVVVHCGDSETQSASRIRVVLAEKDPLILGYNQETWAREFDYHNHPVEIALATVDAVRANTAALLRRLPDTAWHREGRHTESGRYSAEDWLRIYAEHLEIHSKQIDANVVAWRAGRSSLPAPA